MPMSFLGNIYFPKGKKKKSSSLTVISKKGLYHLPAFGTGSLPGPKGCACGTQHKVMTEQEVKIAVFFLLSILTLI